MFQLFPELNLLPCDGEIILINNFISIQESRMVFDRLQRETPWKQVQLKIYGKEIPFPRLTAWYANEGKQYTYSGIVNVPLPWTDLLLELKQGVEDASNHLFNSSLLNFYRDERDSMGWHSDDETELGLNPVIASLSIGGTREFQLKHKTNPALKVTIALNSGSLLIMRGSTQHHWLHQIPKQKHAAEPRINITFRTI